MGPASIKNRLASGYLKSSERHLSGAPDPIEPGFPTLDFASDLFDQAEKCEDRAAAIQSQDESLALRLRERALELKSRAIAVLQILRQVDCRVAG